MGLFTSTQFNSLDDLLVEQLKDLYDAENRLVDALPKMAEAASCQQLKTAFEHHLTETRGQVDRLNQAFAMLGESAERKTCDAMKGLISEGEEMIGATGDSDVKDAALIAAAQRVEHYEMAGYGAARAFAAKVGRQDVAQLLQTTLDEEGAADEKLTQIAANSVNPQAASA